MALSIDEANTVSSKYYDKTLTPQVYERSPLFWKLKSANKVSTDGGTQIQFAIRYTTLGQAEAVGPRAQVAYQQKETRTGGVDDWKYYVATTMIQWDERVKNTGKPQIINLLKDKAQELQDDMFNKFTTDLYATTQQTLTFNALITLVDSTTTCSGIAYTDAAEWVATEDGTTTRLVLYGSGSLSYMINTATFGSDGPNFIVTSRNLQSKAESIIDPQKRYEDVQTADAGFRNVKFHGIPIVGDYACPAGYMFGLDTSKLEFRFASDYQFKVSPWGDLDQAGFLHAMKKSVSWAGNLITTMRKTHFKYTALDYTL